MDRELYETNTAFYLDNMIDCQLNGTRVQVKNNGFLQGEKVGTIVGKIIDFGTEFYIVKYDISCDDGEECGAWYLESLKIL